MRAYPKIPTGPPIIKLKAKAVNATAAIPAVIAVALTKNGRQFPVLTAFLNSTSNSTALIA